MPAPDDDPDAHAAQAADPDPAAVAQLKPERALNAEFVALFDMLPTVAPNTVESIPPVTYDHVVAGPAGPEQFATSDQCLSCHDGQGAPFGPNMLYRPRPNRGASTYHLMGSGTGP